MIIKSVLIVRMSSLGDILHMLPVVYSLCKKFPGITIDWVVDKRCQPLLEEVPIINRLIVGDSSIWRQNIMSPSWFRSLIDFRHNVRENIYDVVIDFHGNCKSSLPVFWARSKVKVGFGRKSVPEWPNTWVTNKQYEIDDAIIEVRERYYALVNQFLGEDLPRVDLDLIRFKNEERDFAKCYDLLQSVKARCRPMILIHPGCSTSKRMLPINSLKVLIRQISLMLDVTFVVAWGSVKEKELAKQLVLDCDNNSFMLPALNIGLLKQAISFADGVIAMDSFALHLAIVCQTPSFSIFGPTLGQTRVPQKSIHQWFQSPCPYNVGFKGAKCSELKGCKTIACMQKLPIDNLIYEVKRFFKNHGVVGQNPNLSLSND